MKTRVGLAVVLVALLLTELYFPSPVEAQLAWYDTDWQYRRPVTVSNTGATTLADFQVLVTLDATFDFAHAQSDGADVRFTADDGTTLLSFWIEAWDAAGTDAHLWVRVPSLPPGDTEIYLYYGNPTAAPAGDGDATFEFFDDFESPPTAYGYYDLSPAATVLEQDQGWEGTAPHTLSVVEVNEGGYRYWGYYALQAGDGGVGLARSNDLLNWDKYSSNPLFSNGRFASVIRVDGTYYMAVTKDYATTSHVVLRTSTDGLTFTEVMTLVSPASGERNQNPCLFQDPNDSLYYLYWFRNVGGLREIRARSATTVEGLAGASDIVVLSSTSSMAAPNMMYYDGTYFLATESLVGSEWQVYIYESTTSPVSGFTPLPDNPILEDGSACFFQHIFDDDLHAYYCKLTGSEWTVDYRSADLALGRNEVPAGLDPAKWTATGGAWSLQAAVQPDGSTGTVARGQTTARQILVSSFSGQDYIVDAYGQQVSGRVWGISVRTTDTDNLYFTNLYEDLDEADNLYIYRRVGGSGARVASTNVGDVDLATWYPLSVQVHGSDIEAYLDGVLQLQGVDSNLVAGPMALYGEAGTVALFDDVRVRKHASPEPTTSVGAEEEQQAWYDSAWAYRVPITINNPGGALSDYQVKIVLDASNFDFSHALPDGADVRFTSDDMVTLLPFWIEEWDTDGQQAHLWVRMPSLPAGDTLLYLYYGNSSATLASDGNATFLSFDDDWDLDGNPIHTIDGEGPWVTSYVSYPNIFQEGSTYYMLYDGHHPHQKGLATSPDLFHWTSHQDPVVTLSGISGAWDETGLAWGDTVKIDDTYYMLVAGLGGDSRWRIGVETSTDLVNWERAPSGATNPVLVASEAWEGGTGGSLSGTSVLKALDGITPVVHSDGHYWMAYHDYDYYQIGLAYADHPLGPWTKYTGNPILSPTEPWESAGLWVTSLIEEDGIYYIFYYGRVSGGYFHMGYAWSDAATEFPATWHKTTDYLLEYGAPGSWDDSDHEDPIIRKYGDTYYLFYTGRGSVYANGVATAPAITGPYTKHEGSWEVGGSPALNTGILTLEAGEWVESPESYSPGHALGYRANYNGGANLYKWAGFLTGHVPPFAYIGQAAGSASGNLILTNYITTRALYDLGPADGAFHTYELTWLSDQTEASMDHGLVGTLTTEVPPGPLPFQFQNYNDDQYVLQVDWAYLRNYQDPEPSATVGDEEVPTAVTLARFEAKPGARHIVLVWETATELDNLGFNLYRSDYVSGPYTQLNDALIPSQAPGLPTGATYEWVDDGIAPEVTYYYRIEAVDLYGVRARFGPVSAALPPFSPYRLFLPLVARN